MMLLAAAFALQDASVDDFYKFKPETAWSYRRLEDGRERAIEGRVLEEKDGRVRLDWKELNLDGSLHEASEVVWAVKDGILWAEARSKGDGALLLELPVLKAGSKKDDRWTTAQGETVHHGVEEVKVPAGTYKDAVHTQLKIGEGDQATLIDFHLVPKVGLVKISVVPPGAALIAFELKAFKPAK